MMAKLIPSFVVLLGLVKSIPVNALQSDVSKITTDIRNNVLEQQVLNLLEDLRQLMITGSDDIPVLDPLQVDQLHVDGSLIDIPGAHLTVNDLLVKQGSTFVIDRISITISGLVILQQYAVEIEGHIPLLDIETGHYDLFLSAMGFEVFGRGDGKVQVIGPKITGSFLFRLWAMAISDTVIEFSLSGFEPQLTGLFYHDGASDFANSFLRNLVPELVQFYEAEITAVISPLVEEIANLVLEDVSIGDFFPQLQHNVPDKTINLK